MLQAIKETVQCSRCGCIALPDATRCPKCGASYHEDKTVEFSYTVDKIASKPPSLASTPDDIRIVRAHYELQCPYHGKVRVKASVVSPSMRCPFC